MRYIGTIYSRLGKVRRRALVPATHHKPTLFADLAFLGGDPRRGVTKLIVASSCHREE
jgi:hypothetical protein